ncbi:benign gonial cell neoplasm protein [Drosophila madeirensis]|uniref:Benign gonial cell neoplasm protein n=2 Tax=Drosophila madeirensis TaxID=30013 RepID=A0AAU9GBD7_DROMD
MNEIIRDKFIPQQLLYFVAGQRCCQEFPCTFRSTDHEIFLQYARSLGLRTQRMFSNGEMIKVFKRTCRHYLEEPKIMTFSPATAINILTMLGRTTNLGKDELRLSSDFIPQRACVAEIMVPHLPFPTIKPPTQRIKDDTQRNLQKQFPGYSFMDTVMQTLYKQRVVVFSADLSWDKSVYMPLLIFEDCEAKKTNAKIICIEKENVLALHNSKRLARYFAEDLGETVGIQLPHSSNISSETHIICSTAQYMLRSLTKQKCLNISHFIVNDVHLHDPYIDVLLSELRIALTQHQNLRVVLLCQMADAKKFTEFFEEGTELMPKEGVPKTAPRISYLGDIHSRISVAGIHKGQDIYKETPEVYRTKTPRNEQMDKCLEAYEEFGSDLSIRPFLYAVNYDLVPVNYRHSTTGKTAVIIAAQHNNPSHLRVLLYMGADPYVADEQLQNAITVAASMEKNECIDILNCFSLRGNAIKSAKPEFVDYDLIIDLFYLLRTNPEYPSGNILVILPTYYHIVKLNYMLLSHYMCGKLQEFSIFLLHENMGVEYIDELVNARKDTDKVVLATDIVESLPLQVSFKYVIDTACKQYSVYNCINYCAEHRYEWVAKDCLLRRESLLDGAASDTQCFRLLSKSTFNMLTESSPAQLQRIQLDKICLTVKALSPHKIISEYLGQTISPPPVINVHHAVQFLKKIEALNEVEELTWLGCRLLDIPVPCQLGRMLIYGILLQCIDPVLTIVTSLSTADPLSIPFTEDIDSLWDRFTIYIQNLIKNERGRLADNQFSDHFIFLRLFQDWQTSQKSKMPILYFTNEYDFILNGLMEQLSFIRSNIVSSLRAAHLIHFRGTMTMQNLNVLSGNWHVVKAALTGGMYPNICVLDVNKSCLKSAYSERVHLHPNTVLRDFLEPFSSSALNFRSPWVVCTKQRNYILYATMVLPLAVAMFAGPSRIRTSQISPSQNDNVNVYIDEWLWMVMPKTVAELVIKTRQCFYDGYHEFLKHCSDQDKWNADSLLMVNQGLINETLAKVFENEDLAVGFSKTPNIHYHPIVKLPTTYLLTVNRHFSWNQEIEDSQDVLVKRPLSSYFDIHSHFIERQFFVLHTKETCEDFYKSSSTPFIESVLGKFARPIESPNRHIFVILYKKNEDEMLSISRAKTINGVFTLKEYFRNVIPVYEIIEACRSISVSMPNFDGRLMSSLIDKRVGNLIMDLFAFRHHWIHKR